MVRHWGSNLEPVNQFATLSITEPLQHLCKMSTTLSLQQTAFLAEFFTIFSWKFLGPFTKKAIQGFNYSVNRNFWPHSNQNQSGKLGFLPLIVGCIFGVQQSIIFLIMYSHERCFGVFEKTLFFLQLVDQHLWKLRSFNGDIIFKQVSMNFLYLYYSLKEWKQQSHF